MYSTGGLSESWYSGPKGDCPMNKQHDKQIVCMDMMGDKVVTGSADHGLREWMVTSGKQKRELFSRKYGHSDWVTSVAYLK